MSSSGAGDVTGFGLKELIRSMPSRTSTWRLGAHSQLQAVLIALRYEIVEPA